MYKDVSLYLNSIKSTASNLSFVDYFKKKGDSTIKQQTPISPASHIDMVYIKPNIKTLNDETMKKYAVYTQKVYKLACKIQELNNTDIRTLDRYMADYNYTHIRRLIEEYLGTLSEFDIDMLNYELTQIDKKYNNQTEIIQIALESLKRFLEHKNIMYESDEDEDKD